MKTSELDLPLQRPVAERAATLIMMLVAIGEVMVAVAVLAMPREVSMILVGAALDAQGTFVARMLGVAILALGITWWMAPATADGPARCSTGFLTYSIGVGSLFGWAAMTASHPALPLIVCVVHLAAGIGFGLLLAIQSKGAP